MGRELDALQIRRFWTCQPCLFQRWHLVVHALLCICVHLLALLLHPVCNCGFFTTRNDNLINVMIKLAPVVFHCEYDYNLRLTEFYFFKIKIFLIIYYNSKLYFYYSSGLSHRSKVSQISLKCRPPNLSANWLLLEIQPWKLSGSSVESLCHQVSHTQYVFQSNQSKLKQTWASQCKLKQIRASV